MSNTSIKKIIADQGYLLFDGAMGTFLDSKLDRCSFPASGSEEEFYEAVNITDPQIVQSIHQEYIKAGSNAIKTNTFGVNSMALEGDNQRVKEILQAGYRNAALAAEAQGIEVFANAGPINIDQVEQALSDYQLKNSVIAEYKTIVDIFLEAGATNFLFETLNNYAGIAETAKYIKEQSADSYIIVSFAISADGFTNLGISAKRIFAEMTNDPNIDSFGFNCICGPTHLLNYVHKFDIKNLAGKEVSIMPNAGYPVKINNRTVFDSSPRYFAEKVMELKAYGVKILGGCCGTTPQHILEIARLLAANSGQATNHFGLQAVSQDGDEVSGYNNLLAKLQDGKKIIAVEVEPPKVPKIGSLLADAEKLKLAGVDCLTIADCPIARVKADSCMMSAKLKNEVGIDVIPHLTCRDRNINATKALLIGLQIEEIQNILVVTGDPLPQNIRTEIKSVYNLNSVRLCNYINTLNEEIFAESPFAMGVALNVNARNFDVELRRAKQKQEQGAKYFLTQAIYSNEAIANLVKAKDELNSYILGGIMPIVSYRNACFINNEVAGIKIPEAICLQFKDKTSAECSQIAVDLAYETCQKIASSVDGYYMITPLNKVELIIALINRLQGRDS